MDYIPQDEYFEWEDVMESRSSSEFSHATASVEYQSSYRTTTTIYEKHASVEIRDFAYGGEVEVEERDEVSKSIISISPSTISWESETISQSRNEAIEKQVAILTFSEDSGSCSSSLSEDEYPSATTSLITHTKDDSAILSHPQHNVDFLSHIWTERDLWMSRRYLRSAMQEHANFARWENACWRSAAKLRLGLTPVSPLSFNWMRDQDDTWLYGPFCSAVDAKEVKKKEVAGKRSILKSPCTKEVLQRGSITSTLVAKHKQMSAGTSRRGMGIRFDEEVQQYCAITPSPSSSSPVSDNEEDEGVWMAANFSSSFKSNITTQIQVVRKLPSTTLKSEATKMSESQPPVIPAFAQEYKSGSTLSEWMWLSGDDEDLGDEDELDWISAAADRTSKALKAADSALSSGNTSSSNLFSSFDSTSPSLSSEGSSSSQDDGLEEDTEYLSLLACDRLDLEMESLTTSTDPSDGSKSSEDGDEEGEREAVHPSRNGNASLERKVGGKMGIAMDEEKRRMYEQIMEEFNVVLE